MIPELYINEWHEVVPWSKPLMVEQDLIICRALVSIFSDDFLRENLAFRGGTALHKLFLQPQPRYSEDIDLVQIKPGPIKPIMFRIGEVLEWLPNRSTQQKRHSNKLLFRVDSEIPPIHQIRLKVEINCFEHFNVLGLQEVPFREKYIEFVTDRAPSYKEFVQNMELKMQDEEFLNDVIPLLRSEINFDPHKAYALVYEKLIDLMSGKRD